MYYLSSKNKGADQMHSYRAADLCLCLGIRKRQGFTHNVAQISIRFLGNVGLLCNLFVIMCETVLTHCMCFHIKKKFFLYDCIYFIKKCLKTFKRRIDKVHFW